MYRTILVAIVYLCCVDAAPQDKIDTTAPQDSTAVESRIEDSAVSVSENENNDRQINNEDTTPLPFDDEDDTPYTLNFFINDIKTTVSDSDNAEVDTKPTTKPDIEVKTKEKTDFESFKPTLKPKYYSKLSYFEKKDKNTVLINLIEHKANRRKFRSNCRCEKISNCPKLQITVPRCPEEQFMCCF